jgi:poly(3-hydroxybutyrate) depolymerase
MRETAVPRLWSAPFLWPALAAASASEFTTAFIKEFAGAAVAPKAAEPAAEPRWATRNTIALELASVRLRAFSTAGEMSLLICAPFALHGASIVDFAPHHSLVAALLRASERRIFVTDWRSADDAMRFFSIDTYLADLNVLVDHLGAAVDLIGLCQGGWMALMYAARFPHKVRRLVLAGAPIDIAAGKSKLSELARNTPMTIFRELVRLGDGRVRGSHALQLWDPGSFDGEAIARMLQPRDQVGSAGFRRLEARFRAWYEWTVDLPGTYYLQVVQRLFKENQLAAGRFVALGRRLDLRAVRIPMLLLAARDDEIVAPAQIFATERLVGTPCGRLRRIVVPSGHLGLFMGRTVLDEIWPAVVQWLDASPDTSTGRPNVSATTASERSLRSGSRASRRRG